MHKPQLEILRQVHIKNQRLLKQDRDKSDIVKLVQTLYLHIETIEFFDHMTTCIH